MHEDGIDLGRRLRQIRHAKGKSLAVVADRAGISLSYLSRLESGARALDRRSLIKALADALEVAPTEITGAVVPSPGHLEEDRTLVEVRLALLAVSMGDPRGQVVPADVLEARLGALMEAQRGCRYAEVGAVLPGLIRDLHTTLGVGRETRHVLQLLVLLHIQGTQAWLTDIGASMDLAWQAVTLGRQAAERLDDPVFRAVSAFGAAHGLLAAGAFDMAGRQLVENFPGTAEPASLSVAGMLTLTSSLIAAASGDGSERVAALDQASDLATAIQRGPASISDPLWFGFSSANVAVWRMSVALEVGNHAEAARIAATVNPAELPSPTRQAAYWREYGRALTRLPRRHDDAVLMLRRAEQISPARIHRHPFMRSVLAELLTKARRDAVGRELRGMAYRAGLPV